MRIIFIRHGQPNYKDDCLTDLGHLQAKAATERLKEENLSRVFSSPCGRAYETAQYIADARSMPVEVLEFMREISWGSVDANPIAQNGHPWRLSDDMISAGDNLLSADWEAHPYFANNKVVGLVHNVADAFDEFLATLGYVREGEYYRVRKNNDDTILIASHGGSSTAVLSRFFNLTFPYLCATVRSECTGITIADLSGEDGALVMPLFEIVSDSRHIKNIREENIFDN